MSPSFEYLRVRKHWKLRLAMVPIEPVLVAIGYTRGSSGVAFVVAAGLLMAATTFPYWRSDARTARDLKAHRARTLP